MREKLKALAFDAHSPMCVMLAGITYPTPNYFISRSNSSIFDIEYVTEGAGYVEIGSEVHRVCADTIYLLYEGEAHRYYSDPETPFSKIFINISGGFCSSLLTAYKINGKHFFDGNGLKPLFERILEIIDSDLSDVAMQCALQGVFLEIISRLSKAESEADYSDEAILLKEYLDSHISRIVTSRELARVIFRSPDYSLKLFKREFGTTPYAYQIDRKINFLKNQKEKLRNRSHSSLQQKELNI